ncbi:Fungal Zn(2)-Cys(6) binuclear cluster domain [Geosmithia morbida]|uniref:Fungal Zn(2)-Cys(6) binuclear cluster domain n=1 Tax=Geosmithia morbida TaxID=1094350 RepID=A0A9P4Z3G6_9HYPO|nr:Fungal Zn(2)-Cys(6) binuclear cluster domain [Geosmithia morbida]KAF4126757.1 Fungal Zn(2)-Cys(6) binuclear cluster domain [Geosmithia morbida]
MENQVLRPGSDGPSAGSGAEGAEKDPNGKKPKLSAANRKRTKTGCLTCRKRRIKCDEGRPTCNNCIKSKRACEGYSQRVDFKEHAGSHHFPDAYGQYAYANTPNHQHAGQRQLAPHPGRPQPQLAMIAPRPPFQSDYHHLPHGSQHDPSSLSSSVAGPSTSLPIDAGVYPFPSGSGAALAAFHQTANPSYSNNLSCTDPAPTYCSAAHLDATSQDAPHGIPAPVSEPATYQEHQPSSDEDGSIAESDDQGFNPGVVAPIASGAELQRSWDSNPRSFASYTERYTLGQYMATPHATELKDDVKRKLFEHFIRVTGPTMSLYERHHFGTEEKDLADAEPVAGRNIWGCKSLKHYGKDDTASTGLLTDSGVDTMPLMSLQHPALLHAMLALSSLQVSKMQETPPTAAHKHYHIALRRIAKNVGSYTKRLEMATVAATLLLAYFELWNSDHTKWCSHLYGARTLFAEMPLRAMAKKFLPFKSLKSKQKIMKNMGMGAIGGPLPKDPNMLDFEFLSTITGFHVVAEDFGLGEDDILRNIGASTTEKEADEFENLRDLVWWFCKLDAYQAILGGAKPFMEYEDWIQIPPRAPMSRLNCVYGTYDHLMLLLARTATFNSKDMERKKRARQAKGAPPPPPGASPPPFVGMLPTKATVPPPMGFSPPQQASTHGSPGSEETEEDFAESYRKALEEWEDIRYGLEAFESRLGADFRPLAREFTDRRDRPFGQTIQYRTYSVAGIWMNYYAALISLQRSHPDMPPAAIQAAGASARQTAKYANMIGRIAVGLSGDCSDVKDISTVLAAAFLESTFCLFVAAIQVCEPHPSHTAPLASRSRANSVEQYQDDEQRRWIIQWMNDVTRLTGWQTARQIAVGCESMWIKTAQMGRGPPYARSVYFDTDNDMAWDTSRRIERRIHEAERTETRFVVARTDRAHYALGLLGVEEDLAALELRDDAFSMRKD